MSKLVYNLTAKSHKRHIHKIFPPDTFSFNEFNVLFDSSVPPKTEFWCITDSTLSCTTKFIFI